MPDQLTTPVPSTETPTTTAPWRRRLGDLLVDAGVLDEGQLAEVLGKVLPEERLGAAVLRLGLATENEIADAIASQLRLDRVDPEREKVDPAALERLPARIAARYEVLPLRIEDDTLVIATADPTDVIALDDLRVAAGVRSVRALMATSGALARARRRVYSGADTDDMLAELDESEPADLDEDETAPAEAAPVIRLVDSIIGDAVRARSSDLHIEPVAGGLVVRIRVDGLLREFTRISRSLRGQVLSRLKIMARLDIAERRLPQDGRAVVRVDGNVVELRVSSMPTLHGETIVLRILRTSSEQVTIDQVGFDDTTRKRFLDALDRPQGLVLVTGPTGSGKTTSMYAGLTHVSDTTRNVLTLEDPIEQELPGVNQTQVEPKAGLTFARGLRHVLRQDPDVVLVGEIRDEETAVLAVEASFTGHLVLATLHTNDAPSAVARLVDLGADRFLVASSLLLVVAQRLARRICSECAEVDRPDPELLRRLGLDEQAVADGEIRRGRGCARCDGTGAHGQVAIGESLPITPRFRDLVTAGASANELGRQARLDGLRPLREEAITRALEGVITLQEALRVTPDPSTDVARCPGCSEPVADDHVACPWCATAIAARHCGGCGRAVDTAWTTCPWCRIHLGGPSHGEAEPTADPAERIHLGPPSDDGE